MLQKVLLVEDSTSLAILYKQYVKDEPYEFFHVTTGEQAKAFMEKNPPHLVILDLKLPDMSGQDVLAWMKEKKTPNCSHCCYRSRNHQYCRQFTSKWGR